MIAQLIRSVINKCGYDITRKPPSMMQPGSQFALTVELLAPYVSHLESEVVFLQVGAYDGKSNDPLLKAAMQHKWRGILVEPRDSAFTKLQALHAGRPEFILKKAAISETSAERRLYSIKDQPGLPDWADQLASFHHSHLVKQLRYLPKGAAIEEETVA